MCVCVCLCLVLTDSLQLMDIAHQAPLSMEFSRQEDWSRLPFPTPGDIPDSGIEHMSFVSPALGEGFFNYCATSVGLNSPKFRYLKSLPLTLYSVVKTL